MVLQTLLDDGEVRDSLQGGHHFAHQCAAVVKLDYNIGINSSTPMTTGTATSTERSDDDDTTDSPEGKKTVREG